MNPKDKPNPLADLWRNEVTGMAVAGVRHMSIYDKGLAAGIGLEGVRRGADPDKVLETVEKHCTLYRGEPDCGDCVTMTHCETHHKDEGTYPEPRTTSPRTE